MCTLKVGLELGSVFVEPLGISYLQPEAEGKEGDRARSAVEGTDEHFSRETQGKRLIAHRSACANTSTQC